MLSRLDIRNFQSLHHVDLELSRFTVIVGQSSSGKSAFTRALRALTSNARGTSFITHGEQTCTITAEAESGTVAFAKGKQDWYKVIPSHGEEKTYTKLGGEVPESVSEMLGIPAKDPINYAGQFDMPYLLRSSPSEVARVLGELTNADIVFNAAKESNRRRLSAASTLRVKGEDYAKITADADKYANLRTRLDTLASAESLLDKARAVNLRITDLDHQASKYVGALQRRARASQMVDVVLPTTQAADEAQGALDGLIGLLKATSSLSKTIDAGRGAVSIIDGEIERLEGEYLAALHTAGTCPTCGQDTTGVAHV